MKLILLIGNTLNQGTARGKDLHCYIVLVIICLFLAYSMVHSILLKEVYT
jgi:hypothetical protein